MDTSQRTFYHITIVDDNPTNIQVATTILREEGFEISIAKSGSQAINVIAKNSPDLILLDVIMPGMDGYETCRTLKGDPATRNIPVIFMSALSDAADKVKGFSAGAIDYITKPVDAGLLLARINTHLTIRNLQKELEKTNIELEDKVIARTTDLIQKNIALEEEIDKRSKIEKELARHRDHLEELVYERTAELTKTNTELRETEERIRSLMETASRAGIGILVIRDDELSAGLITFSNPAIERMTGYSAEDLSGSNFVDLLHAKDREKARNEFVSGRFGKMDLSKSEYLVVTKHGNCVPVEVCSENSEYEGSTVLVSFIEDISKRKASEEELKEANKQLIEVAHRAGMADIAAGIIHNVGNILNSVKSSAYLMRQDVVQNSGIKWLKKANALQKEHESDIEDFIVNNPKGKQLLQFYMLLEGEIEKVQSRLGEEIDRLDSHVNKAIEVISAQQAYAGTSSFSERMDLSKIVNDTLAIHATALESDSIAIDKDFQEIPEVLVQKTKLIHILTSLIQNAKEAMIKTPSAERKLKISIVADNEAAFIRFSDTGCGIKKENLRKIFFHGFSTKESSQGFGLHRCANYMTEMGGRMWAESEGSGAIMVLRFPLEKKV
ncbi:response regulator [bacterium]|nr:response regulator [bacterium]